MSTILTNFKIDFDKFSDYTIDHIFELEDNPDLNSYHEVSKGSRVLN